MSAAFRKAKLFTTPWMQCRHNRPNIQRPRPGPVVRRVLSAVTESVLPEDLRNPALTCSRMGEKMKEKPSQQTENKFERFLVNECRKVFEQHRMLMVIQPKPLKANDLRALRNKFINAGMNLGYDFPTQVIHQVVKDSKWRNMSPLFIGHELLVVSDKDCIKEIVLLAKKTSDFLLLAGVLDDRLLSRAELDYYASLPDLLSVQGQTSAVLSSALSRTHSLLSHHQKALAQSLDTMVHNAKERDNKD